MMRFVPLYRPKLKQEWRVSRSPKAQTLGGIRGKCQSSSQEIVQAKSRRTVEGWYEAQVVVEGYPGGGDAPPAPVVSVGEGAGSALCAGVCGVLSGVAGWACVVAGGASCSVAGSTVSVVGGVVAWGVVCCSDPAGATGASVVAGSPPAAGRPGSRTSMYVAPSESESASTRVAATHFART